MALHHIISTAICAWHSTTTTAFETRNTGVTLEVEPVVEPDGVTIGLNLVPQVVEFEGFINYGSPIQTTSTNLLGITQTNILTPNIINQPIFSSRKVTTSVSVWDGQTVVLGGLMREDVQKVEDRTPILGDIRSSIVCSVPLPSSIKSETWLSSSPLA